MPGSLEQTFIRKMRRVDELIATLLVALTAVVLHKFADNRALRMPDR